MNLIIKFYYCKICGVYDNKQHLFNHDNDDEYFGYQVFYEDETNKIYIQDTYASYNSVITNDDCDVNDWLYEGDKHNLNYLINNNLDLEINDRYLDYDDYNYQQIRILYDKLLEILL